MPIAHNLTCMFVRPIHTHGKRGIGTDILGMKRDGRIGTNGSMDPSNHKSSSWLMIVLIKRTQLTSRTIFRNIRKTTKCSKYVFFFHVFQLHLDGIIDELIHFSRYALYNLLCAMSELYNLKYKTKGTFGHFTHSQR